MIALFIFYIHFIGLIYAFSKGTCEKKLSEGLILAAFVAVIFSVGWTIAGFIVRFVFPPQGYGPFFDRDTLSLLIVTLLEAILYFTYFFTQRTTAVTAP